MSFQNLLTNDYTKSMKEFLRFVIIVGNVIVFYYFCGMRTPERFGPKIDERMRFASSSSIGSENDQKIVPDPLSYTSTLDMIAMLLAVFVAMKQLTFGRPEIDSFNEIIYFIPQERNSAVLLFLFTIFKGVYQFFWSISQNLDIKTRGYLLMAKANPVNPYNPRQQDLVFSGHR